MKTIPLIVVALIASVVTAADVPAGWKVLTDKTKNCQIAVPADWIVSEQSPDMAGSPDKRLSVAVQGTDKAQAFDEAKSAAKRKFPPARLIEDSASRILYMYKPAQADDDNPMMSFYVSIPAKGNVCSAQIIAKDSESEALMSKMAQTLAAAK